MAVSTLLRRLFLPKFRSTMEWHMLDLLNKDRRTHGLKPLFMQLDLRDVARKHSRDMAKNDYFEHENLSGQSHADRYIDSGISDTVSGENLAKIRGFKFPTQRAEVGLMNSPGHRANILNKSYNCVGIGLHKAADQTYYYTQNFAYRELMFKGRMPKKVKLKSGLKLHFKPVVNVRHGFYRLTLGKMVVKEKAFTVKQGLNALHINFSEPGRYQLEIYTSNKGDGSYRGVNKISLYVSGGWFW